MTNWNQYYQNYPVNQELIWLNNCGTTPVGTKTIQDVTRYLEAYSKQGVFNDVEKYTTVKRRITEILSELIHCEQEEIGIIHNTSEGINFISHGLNLLTGDEILLLENEYPSNVYPFQHWEEKGVKLRFVPMANSPSLFLENLKSSITKNTKVISLSLVHWCTGMPLPTEEIGRICKEKDIEFIVDGAQGVGLLEVDVRKMNISYMAFPAWKWLLGPLGLGGIYIAKDKLATMKTIFKGQNSVVNADEYLPYKSELKAGADRFEYSTGNFTDWVYWKSTLEMLSEIGFPTVRSRIYELKEYLADGLRKNGFQIYSDAFPEFKTGILACEKSGVDSSSLVKHLRENQVISAVRLGRVRLAPHLYNSVEQLDKVIALLSR
ncbi:MAG: aminotransferase class V-fold PLP-dependent enzyme [Leptospiraceae bacterium]|nr:aminotransferase class V-fold PLP-dependent enzyme [Leptospiraceae bacterium]